MQDLQYFCYFHIQAVQDPAILDECGLSDNVKKVLLENIKLFVVTFSKSHFWHLGKKEVLMSVKDFYNAVTPGSSLTHGVGRGVYTILGKDDICSATTYGHEKLPVESKGRPSLLNEVH